MSKIILLETELCFSSPSWHVSGTRILFKKQQKKPSLFFNKEEFCIAAVPMKVTNYWKASLLIKWTPATHKDLSITVCLLSTHFRH